MAGCPHETLDQNSVWHLGIPAGLPPAFRTPSSRFGCQHGETIGTIPLRYLPHNSFVCRAHVLTVASEWRTALWMRQVAQTRPVGSRLRQ